MIDVAKLESILGVKPEMFADEGVAKVNFPRTDVRVAIEGRLMESFMGLTSWVSFQKGTKKGVEAMIMGDLVLFEDEVNPAMSVALENDLEVTALHNHFFFDAPNVYFMHIGGEGTTAGISESVRKVRERVALIRKQHPAPQSGFGGASVPTNNSIDGGRIEKILGVRGIAKDGMYKVIVGRETTAACGCKVGKAMGVNTWAAFAGTDDSALVDGDFALLEEELRPVLKSLRESDINVVAIHNHMIQENPRFVFVHYWGKGSTDALASALKRALDLTAAGKPSQHRCCEGR